MSTPKQIKHIKMLQKQLEMSDDIYREMLWQYGAESCKDLTDEKAKHLIATLQVQAKKSGMDVKVSSPSTRWKYNELADRDPKFATPKQLRMLNAMWHSSEKVKHKTDDAFENFVERIAKVKNLKWLKAYQVSKIKLAIEHL